MANIITAVMTGHKSAEMLRTLLLSIIFVIFQNCIVNSYGATVVSAKNKPSKTLFQSSLYSSISSKFINSTILQHKFQDGKLSDNITTHANRSFENNINGPTAPPINQENTHNETENGKALQIWISKVNSSEIKDSLLIVSWRLNYSYFLNDYDNINNNNDSDLDRERKRTYDIVDGFVISHTLLENDTTHFTRSMGNGNRNTSKSLISESNDKIVPFSDVGMEFKSPFLSANVSYLYLHDLTSSLDRGVMKVCVYVIFENGGISAMKSATKTNSCCYWTGGKAIDGNNSKGKTKYEKEEEEDDDEGTSSMKKMVTGVAAGLVFMVPCVVVLIFIWRKDRQMKLSAVYEEVDGEHLNAGMVLGDEGLHVKKEGGSGHMTGTEEAEKGLYVKKEGESGHMTGTEEAEKGLHVKKEGESGHMAGKEEAEKGLYVKKEGESGHMTGTEEAEKGLYVKKEGESGHMTGTEEAKNSRDSDSEIYNERL